MEGGAAAGGIAGWAKEGGGGAGLEEAWKALAACGPGGSGIVVERDEGGEAADAVG